MSRNQFELPHAGLGAVFNLAGEAGDDPFRVERERWEQAERQREAAEYVAKMQLSLRQCPGFVSCDAPASDKAQGRVVVEPGRVTDAMPWLRRRFHVSENLGLSLDDGLVVEIKPRIRNKTGCVNRGKRLPVTFERPQQFELGLNTESND